MTPQKLTPQIPHSEKKSFANERYIHSSYHFFSSRTNAFPQSCKSSLNLLIVFKIKFRTFRTHGPDLPVPLIRDSGFRKNRFPNYPSLSEFRENAPIPKSFNPKIMVQTIFQTPNSEQKQKSKYETKKTLT